MRRRDRPSRFALAVTLSLLAHAAGGVVARSWEIGTRPDLGPAHHDDLLAVTEFEPPPEALPPPPLPPPLLPPEPEIRLGSQTSQVDGQAWLGFNEGQPHFASPSEVDQPALTTDPPPGVRGPMLPSLPMPAEPAATRPESAPTADQAAAASMAAPAETAPEPAESAAPAEAAPTTPESPDEPPPAALFGPESTGGKPPAPAGAEIPEPEDPSPESLTPQEKLAGLDQSDRAQEGEELPDHAPEAPSTQIPQPTQIPPPPDGKPDGSGDIPIPDNPQSQVPQSDPMGAGEVGEAPRQPAGAAATPAEAPERPQELVGPPALAASPSPPPRPAVSPGGGGEDSGQQSDRESTPTSVLTARKDQLGKPIAGNGLEIKTVRPRFTQYTKIMSAPRSPVFRIFFRADGAVENVEIVRSSGVPDVDRPVLDAVYRWRASGQELRQLGPVVAGQPVPTISVEIRILL